MGISKRLLVFAVIFLASCALIVNFVWVSTTGVLVPPSLNGVFSGQDKIAIQKISGNASTAIITVYAQSTGDGPVVLDSVIIWAAPELGERRHKGLVKEIIHEPGIDDNDANTGATVPTVDAELTRLDITTTPGTLIVGEIYTVTLVTTTGYSFDSEAFTAVAYKYPW